MNEETAAQFVHSVVKSLQALCHGYVEFGQSVEIIGHLYLNVDKRKKYNYIVQEQVCKSETEGSTIFISNSYLAATPGKKVVLKQQESSLAASELKLHGNKKSVDYIPYNEQGPSQEVSHSVSDDDDLSSISVAATSHDVQPMYSSTPQSDNVYHRKRNHSGGLNREQGDFLSVRSGSVGETAKQFNKGELFPNEQTSHSGSSFSPKAAQRISSNIERALNSGNFSKNENTSSGYSGVADNDKTRHLIASVPEDFSNNISHDHNVLPADVQSSDIIRPHQRMSLGAVSKTVTNESRKRFLKDHCFSAVRHRAYTSDNDFNVDLSCVKKETDVTAATPCEERIVYHDQRSWNKTNIGDPQDSSSYSGEDECKMDSGTDDDNVITSQDLTQQSTPYPLTLHPNTGASGYGGPVFPQNFADNSLDQTSALSSDNDTVATSSSLNISGRIPTSSGFSRGPFNNPSAPRPGKVSAEVASKYNTNPPRPSNSEGSLAGAERYDGIKCQSENNITKNKLKELLIQTELTQRQRFVHLTTKSWPMRNVTVDASSATSSDHPLNLCMDSPSPSKDPVQGIDSTLDVSGCAGINNSMAIVKKVGEKGSSTSELQSSPSRKPKVSKIEGDGEHEDTHNPDETVHASALQVDVNYQSFSAGSFPSESGDSFVVKTELVSTSEDEFSNAVQYLPSPVTYEHLDARGSEECEETSKHIVSNEAQKVTAQTKYGKLPTVLVSQHGFESVMHYLELIPATLKQNRGARKRCRVCYATGRRRDTRFQCAVCKRKPGLCPVPCMQRYHDQMTLTHGEFNDSMF